MKGKMIKRGVVSFHDTNTERPDTRPKTIFELSSDAQYRLSKKARRRMNMLLRKKDKFRNLNSDLD